MKMEEIKNKSEEELAILEEETRRELFALLNEKRINRSLEKPHLIKAKRKVIARIKTHLSQQSKAKG